MRLPPSPTLAALAALAAAPAAAQTIVLPDIVVSANRTPTAAAATGASVSVLTESDLVADGRPFVLEPLSTVPGVTIQQNGPPGTLSGFAIRGAPQQYVRVQVDGIEISDPTGPQVTPYLQGLLVDDISRIEVLKGSQSALYGAQAVAGVIDITSPRATEPGLAARYLLEGGSHATFRGALGLTGLGERGDFALTLARLKTDGFSAAEEADGNTEADGYDGTRVSGNGTLYVSDTVSLFGSAFYQDESGDFDGTGFPPSTFDAPNTFDSHSWGARAGVNLLAAGIEHTIALSYYDTHRHSESLDPVFGPFTFITDGSRERAEYLGAKTLSPQVSLQFGADYTRESSKTNLVARESAWDAGAFVQTDWTPSEAVTINAALRQDQHSEFGGHTTGRLTGAWTVGAATVLRASLGTGFLPPSIFQLFDPQSGNPDLDPETSTSADVGVTQGFAGGRGTASATLFWLEIEDLIEFVGNDVPPNFGRYEQTDGTSKSQGLELSAGWALTEALTLTGGYTYTDAKLPSGARRDRIPRHVLNAALDGAVTERINLGLGLQYFGDYYDATGPQDTAGFARDFFVVNARVGYEITEQAELYLRAENLTDAQYQTARGYSTSDQAVYFGIRGVF
jgi:vitamin B12 transporter